jgi:hypothetical protein
MQTEKRDCAGEISIEFESDPTIPLKKMILNKSPIYLKQIMCGEKLNIRLAFAFLEVYQSTNADNSQ